MLAHLVSILLLQSVFALSVQASLYVIQPRSGSTCSGGKPCTVEWLDDGLSPLLSQIGATYIALYNGDNVLVQQIEPVDLSVVHSLQFTPDPKAGPSSDRYYINFTSVSLIGGVRFTEYSPTFSLNGMEGALASPVASDTSPISVPSSILSASPNPISVTSTVSPTGSTASASSSPVASSSSGSGSTATTSSIGRLSSSASPAPDTTSTLSASSSSPSRSASSGASSSSSTSAFGSSSAHGVTPLANSTSASASPSVSASASDAPAPTTLTVPPATVASGFSTARSTATTLVSETLPAAPGTTGVSGGVSTSGGVLSVRAASGICGAAAVVVLTSVLSLY